MSIDILIAALVLGMVSSLHCVAMCGPIVLMLPVARNNPERKALQIISYHLGRITTYTFLGFIFGFFGRALSVAGMQQYLSITAGMVMILMVLLPKKTFQKYSLSTPAFRLIGRVKSAMASHLKKQSFFSLYSIGLLNGFLPCAMVYGALFGALSTQNVLSGMVFMAVFGLGTVPLMSMVNYLYRYITMPIRNRLQKLIPYTMIVMGMLLILRGLVLDIDHVSPSVMSLFIKAEPNCG
ncbi:sulfite exporter TauE/SafE family protein [Flavobacterium sp. BFFFF1]|uniref:sulfite exporter TauE/SafE family protein n=1 Tax=Flavobacterium sp. BFFFF1 TaxID=2015557 RepID=UPI0025BC8274|nr:sulfite exporter TauE/SafE family protein [Flavobacterium sp. BFFFF1]